MNKYIANLINEEFHHQLLNFDDSDDIQFNKSKVNVDNSDSMKEYLEEQEHRLNNIMNICTSEYSWENPENRDFLQSIIKLGKNSKIKYKANNNIRVKIYKLMKKFGNDIDLNWIDVSNVLYFDWMFVSNKNKPTKYDSWHRREEYNDYEDISDFCGDISEWDTSNVKYMSYMLYKNDTFKSDISNWDTSNVTDMQYMFAESEYRGDISKWNVSKVTDMNHMFYKKVYLNTDFSNWDVSHVTNMESMFEACLYLDDNGLSTWKTPRCRNMKNMFNQCAMFMDDLSQWNVSHVKTMEGMFSVTSYFNSNLNNWNVSRVENMCNMFNQANAFNSPLDKWDVSDVEDMLGMFSFAHNFKQDISMWDVDFVEKHGNMFSRNFPEKYKPIAFQNEKN